MIDWVARYRQMNSVRVTDAKSEEEKQLAIVERLRRQYETRRGQVGMAEEARKMRGQRIQSPREQQARTNLSKAYGELYAAERKLAELRAGK
jgi:uncharacterized Zn finger protein